MAFCLRIVAILFVSSGHLVSEQWTFCLQIVAILVTNSGHFVCELWPFCLQTVAILLMNSGHRVYEQRPSCLPWSKPIIFLSTYLINTPTQFKQFDIPPYRLINHGNYQLLMFQLNFFTHTLVTKHFYADEPKLAVMKPASLNNFTGDPTAIFRTDTIWMNLNCDHSCRIRKTINTKEQHKFNIVLPRW